MLDADIVLESPLGERIMAVDVYNRVDLNAADRPDAGTMPIELRCRYYMVVSQEKALIWSAQDAYVREISLVPVIKRFLPNLLPDKRLYGFQVADIVSAWLSQLAAGWRDESEDPESALASIGILDAIRGARVLSETAA